MKPLPIQNDWAIREIITLENNNNSRRVGSGKGEDLHFNAPLTSPQLQGSTRTGLTGKQPW